MIKTQNKSSIIISKLAFLDEMLPDLEITNDAEYGETPYFSLKNTDKFLELIKKLAAKVLTEGELVNILGDESKDCMWNRIKYTPQPELTDIL